MNKFLIYLLIAISAAGVSCSTDFEVNSEWKDITLVYGLLDQKEDTHFVKVNKAFLGERDAYEMAKNPDSVNYANANVFLEELKEGNPTGRKLSFTKISTIPKLPGEFGNGSNILYYNTDVLNEQYTYKLNVYIGQKHVYAKTNLIKDMYIEFPTTLESQRISFESFVAPFRAKWKSAENGRIYELIIRFHYWERRNGQNVQDSVDWVQPITISPVLTGSQALVQEIACENFYVFVANKIKDDPQVSERWVTKKAIDFIFSVGGDDLNTYIDVSRPSDGLTQDKPAFTNITNGIGIFSCRTTKGVYKKGLSEKTVQMLSKGDHTKHLKFRETEQQIVK